MLRPKLVQQVFEARYERGYRYLDRCGEVLLILEDVLPAETGKAWMPDDIVPTGAKLKCPDLDITVFFDTYRVVVDQSVPDGSNAFVDVSRVLFATLSARLDLRQFERLGCRRFFMQATDSVEEAERLSLAAAPPRDLGKVLPERWQRTSSEFVETYENPERDGGFRFTAKPSARFEAPLQIDQRLQLPPRLRHKDQAKALIDQLKRQAKREKTPLAGILLDVDVFQLRPVRPDVDSFLAEAVELSDDLTAAFGLRLSK